MKDPVTYFFSVLWLKDKAIIFKKLIYLFLLFKCAYWFLNYKYLFGEDSVIADKEVDISGFRDTVLILYSRANQWLCAWAIILVMILSILSFLQKNIYFIFDFVLWFLILNLHYRVYSTLTAGDFLLNQLLLFNCFILLKKVDATSQQSWLKTCLHNFAIMAVIIQVCFLYLASGIIKLQDADWMSGKAIAFTSQVNHFNLFNPIRFSGNSFLAIILNYTVLLYQLLFPVLIWVKKTKKMFLILGIGIHLYIAFVMGLVSFGLLMIIPYVLFWPSPKEQAHKPPAIF